MSGRVLAMLASPIAICGPAAKWQLTLQAQLQRRLVMITDVRASKLFLLLYEGESVAGIARRLNMSEKTIRKYRDTGLLPSQIERPERTYRTRPDPLEEFWEEIEERLEHDSRLKPYAILDWLKQKHNPPEGEPRVTDSIRRTLERRVQRWKLEHGVQQEVMFPQVHHAGDVIAFDFVVMNSLKITIGGKPFDHKLFHAVFTYSNWEYVHLCHSESFEALSTGLQDALHRAGGVPRRVRSDSLSAAVNNLSDDREFAASYRDLLEHYGLQGHRINVRKPHENGDVESSHGHFKDALDQALRLRESRDFGSVDDYAAFLRQLTVRLNASREKRFREEAAVLNPLPPQRRTTCTSVPVTVKSDSIIRIKRNAYSVSSKYVGLKLEVRIYQDHLELWYGNQCVEHMPRQFGQAKEAIDFRHVIDSLVRKPGAFINYRYVNHMYPTTRFRMAYDQLLDSTTEASAVRQYLKILHAAKHEGLDLVDDTLRWFLTTGKPIRSADVLKVVASKQELPAPTDVRVDAPDLSVFDSLLQHKDVYHEQDVNHVDTQAADVEAKAALAAYDRHVEAAGSAQGVAAADIPRKPHADGRASGTGALDSHPVPRGSGREGVSGTTTESDSSAHAKCPSAGGEDVGSGQLVSIAPACDSAIRDASTGRLPGSPGQSAGVRQARFGQDDAAFCAGGSARHARSSRLLHHLSDAGSGATTGQTGLASGASDQEAPQVRGIDHRRLGLRPAEPRGDGSALHTAGREIRTGQSTREFESALFAMGADLQGSHDNGCRDRPADPSLGDHRTQHPQLSARRSQKETTPLNRLKHWFKNLKLAALSTASLIVAKGPN
jgi:transposase